MTSTSARSVLGQFCGDPMGVFVQSRAVLMLPIENDVGSAGGGGGEIDMGDQRFRAEMDQPHPR